MSDIELIGRLATALAIGLLIGVERGWQSRGIDEGGRIAGVRSFGLVGILGALVALLGVQFGTLVVAFGFVAFGILFAITYWFKCQISHDYGITTEIALFVTLALGALCIKGNLSMVAGTAVVVTVLLGLKPTLHHWVKALTPEELHAALRLLRISVVLLPILPDRGFGPWQALNPYAIWWMVVLIAALSFLGYFAVRIAGPSRGVMLTALSGGLASSTAVALNYSRLAAEHPYMQRLLAAGVLVASATMFPRMLIVVGIVQPAILPTLIWPLGIMMLITYGVGFWQWRVSTRTSEVSEFSLRNPFEFKMAVQFGLLLAVIMVLAKALLIWMGETGIYLLAAISGLSDVDAISLSLSRMVPADLQVSTAGIAITIAAMVNTTIKGLLTLMIASRGMALRVCITFAVVLLCGAAALWIAA